MPTACHCAWRAAPSDSCAGVDERFKTNERPPSELTRAAAFDGLYVGKFGVLPGYAHEAFGITLNAGTAYGSPFDALSSGELISGWVLVASARARRAL